MPNVADTLTDLQIQHALNLLRVGNGVDRDILKLLKEMEKDVSETLAKRLILIDQKGFDRGPKTTERLNTMITEIRSLIDPVYAKSSKQLKSALETVAINEGEFQARAVKRAIPAPVSTRIPSPVLLKSIATERPILGKLLEPMLKEMSEATKSRVEQQIRLGHDQGEGVEMIVARVMGFDGLEWSRRSMRTVVRTSVSAVANHAQQETWRANAHVIKGWRFVATLDSRTTIVCASHDGEVHPIGEGPIPPLHLNCRSTTVAVTKSWEEMGLDRKQTTADTRASIDGQVSNRTFDKWLKDQGEDRQNEILGPTRAQLFRDGKLNLNDFLRNDREVMTLDELRKAHPEAFDLDGSPAPAPAPKAPAGAGSAFTTPVNDKVTADTIVVRKRRDVEKELSADFATNARDPRYDPRPEYRGIKPETFGKAALTSDLTDEAASMLHALQPELDALSDAFAIPRLRAMRTSKAHSIASMGDGVLTVNPTFFNAFASTVGGRSPATVSAALVESRDALVLELKAMSDDLAARKIAIRDAKGDDLFRLQTEFINLAEIYNAKRAEWMKLDKKVMIARRGDAAATKPVSTWKIGDDKASRPFNGTEYFTGIDKARNVLFHEFGHHVHQMFRKIGRRTQATPPIEIELKRMFFTKFQKDMQARKLFDQMSTTYATTNAHEWFAESFGLYMMGRKDLVDPDLIKLIERLLDEVKNGSN